MPNWCNNTVEIYHDDPAMIERARKAFNDAKFLNEFVPIPESLHIVSGRCGADDNPEQIALEAAQKSNIEQHGYKDWYDYCVNEWGTKWDVGGDGYEAQDIPSGLMLTFESAWAPPVAAYDKLEAQGFRIRAMYYEPGMGFAGVYEDGHDDYYEYGGMNSAAIAEELPAELDEAFCISEDVAQWEAENEEENLEIDLDGGVSAVNEQEKENE
jgi:hypothetical protein